jgi:hypothetical protein
MPRGVAVFQPRCASFLLLLAPVLLLLLLLALPAPAGALECFACHDINSKFKCRTTTICNSEEICLVQKVYSSFTGPAGEPTTMIYYNMACKRREQCVNEYKLGTNFKVQSRYINTCCCTDRCVEEDGTGYGDYTHCFNALTEDEARRWRGGAAKLCPSITLTLILIITPLLIGLLDRN